MAEIELGNRAIAHRRHATLGRGVHADDIDIRRVERQDVRAFQARTPATAGAKRGGLAVLRSYKKLWGAVAGIMFGGYALIRIIGRFKGY